MVKGISKQVIVVHAPDPKLFEQAIFILKEDAVQQAGVTDQALLREARRLISTAAPAGKKMWHRGPLWALGGGGAVGALWLLTLLL